MDDSAAQTTTETKNTLVQTLKPGMVFTSNNGEIYLLLWEPNTGGTSRLFVAIPLRSARACGLKVPLNQFPATVGVHEAGQEMNWKALAQKFPVVLLKILNWNPEHKHYKPMLRAFIRETYALSKEHHLQIPRFLGAGEQPVPHVVLELLTGGQDLYDWLADFRQRQRRVGAQDFFTIAVRLLSVYAHLHRRGMVFQDIKPENIYLVDVPGIGLVPIIVDFGGTKFVPVELPVLGRGLEHIAQAGIHRAESPPSGHARTRLKTSTIATLGNAAPEQLDPNAPVTEASDVFGAATVLYEMLAGVMPFGTGEDSSSYYVATRSAPPEVSHPEIQGGVMTRLNDLLVRMMHFVQERRPTMQAALDVLIQLKEEYERDSRRRSGPAALPPGMVPARQASAHQQQPPVTMTSVLKWTFWTAVTVAAAGFAIRYGLPLLQYLQSR